RKASADRRAAQARQRAASRKAGVVFRQEQKENHPVCAEQGGFATSYLTAQSPLLAVMQGGEYASACNSFTGPKTAATVTSLLSPRLCHNVDHCGLAA